MVNPVPKATRQSPGYGVRGKHWSCKKTSAGGVHTGIDFPAPKGTSIYACRPGTVRHTKFGSAFGPYQFAVVASDGSADFYAHTLDRPKSGTKVKAGQKIARVGSLGNSTGPHLHLERLAVYSRGWNCSNHRDPKSSINYKEASSMGVKYKYMGKGPSVTVGRDYKRLAKTKYKASPQGLELVVEYLNINSLKFRPGKEMGSLRLRLTRTADKDHTGYLDIPLHKDLADGKGQILVTHLVMKWKPGETEWSVKAIGGLESCRITTNYRSTGTVTA
jgi:murein DD-endopeptidase MepM/ murein hydrolase activator NlpD